MFAVHWILTLSTATLNTQIRKNGVVDAFCVGGQLTHVLYLTASDSLAAFVRASTHGITTGCAREASCASSTFTRSCSEGGDFFA